MLYTHTYIQEPVVAGCFLRAKPIGVMHMVDQGEIDDKARDNAH